MKAIRLLPLASLAMLLVATLQAAEHTVEVKAETVNLYIEPDTTSKVFATASKGTVLAIQETTRDWYRVSAPGSGYGVWVRKVDLEAAPTASKPAAVPSTPPAMPQPQPNQPGSPGTVAGGLSIEHQGVGCVMAGKFPEFDAKLDPADQVSRAQIDFHAEDDPRWYFVAMKLENGVYRGILPQPLKETKRIHYYIEATGSDLTTSRTQEYTPEVVESAGVCVSRKTVAVVVASASVVVQAVVPGAPAIPAGFSAAGLATTTSEVASTASVAGGSGAASHSGLIIGLVGGVGAAAAGAGAAAGHHDDGARRQGDELPAAAGVLAVHRSGAPWEAAIAGSGLAGRG